MRIIWESQYKRDYKRMMSRGKDMSLLNGVVKKLAQGKSLLQKHRDHQLRGGLSKYRECHIESDWLLMYKKSIKSLILVRMGSHSDLFQ